MASTIDPIQADGPAAPELALPTGRQVPRARTLKLSVDARLILRRGLLAHTNQNAGEGPDDRSVNIDPCLACQSAENLTAARLQVAVVDNDVIARHEHCDVPMHDKVRRVLSCDPIS